MFPILFLGTNQDSKIYFIDDSGGFKIWAIADFSEKYQKIETEVGEIEVFSYFYEPKKIANDPNFLYLINYMEYPDNSFNGDVGLQEELFEDTINSTLNAVDGELQYNTDETLDDHPGKLSRLTYDEGHIVVKSKMFLVDDRFYYIQVYATQENALNLKMDEFLDSFSLL